MAAPSKRTLRTDLPADVWDRLAAEAAAKGLTLAAHARNLIVARDKKQQDKQA